MLCGLPQPSYAQLFSQHHVQLVISCFRESLQEKGAYIHPGAKHCNIVITHPPSRASAWESIKSHVFNTLHALHGGGFVALLGWPLCWWVMRDGLSYDDALRRIRNLRAVEPEKGFERQGGEATSVWLRRITDTQPRPPVSVAHALKLLASSREGSAIHALSVRSSETRLPLEAGCI